MHCLTIRCCRLVALALLIAAPRPGLAAPIFSDSLTTINVDGSALLGGQAASFAYEAGTYHMWYRPTTAGPISGMRHATSADGINFADQGALSFAVDPFVGGTPPYLFYENVNKVGSDYLVQHWTYFGGQGSFPAYSYNLSISNLGADPNNLVADHEGALSRLGDDTVGSAGIVDDRMYGPTGARWLAGGAFTGTGYDFDRLRDFTPEFTAAGAPTGYISNHGDVVPVGDDLGFFFAMRYSSGARLDSQVYYSDSLDGGLTWSGATGLFVSPLLDGVSPLFPFSHPDVIDVGGKLVLYLNTQDADGNFVFATTSTAAAVPEPSTLLLLGAGGLLLRRRRR